MLSVNYAYIPSIADNLWIYNMLRFLQGTQHIHLKYLKVRQYIFSSVKMEK